MVVGMARMAYVVAASPSVSKYTGNVQPPLYTICLPFSLVSLPNAHRLTIMNVTRSPYFA